MTVDSWSPLARLLWRTRESAFPAGEFVGQESFVSASEVRWLAGRAGVGTGVSVLDLCCGEAGPGIFVARTFGCRYLGVDADAGSIARARARAVDEGVDAAFEVRTVPPVPRGAFDVVFLLETLLAFADKPALVHEVASALPVGGRFAFTLEAGRPLSAAERAAMPGADTVWLTTLTDLRRALRGAGFRVRSLRDTSHAHRRVVDGLVAAYAGAAPDIRAAASGSALVVDDLLTAHRLWSEWLRTGRVRKFAVVTEKVVQGAPLM
ncbi:SAM-dependent methyltransferase [Knoellia sp. CPCC 206435]|uniref:SAM-dependent methyltransferase n=1 Tax=Knoellia terrae TaxID=3404797 RepID=UPI003B42ED15